MNAKRIAVAILWPYAGLAAGTFLEHVTGLPAGIGMALGVAAAVFFAGDPLHLVWPARRESSSNPAAPELEAAAA